MTHDPDNKDGKPDKKPKPRRTGQRETIVVGRKAAKKGAGK